MPKRRSADETPSAKRSKRASRTARRGYDAEAATIESINDGDALGRQIGQTVFGSAAGTITARKGTHGAKSDILIRRSGVGPTVTRGMQVKLFRSLPGYNSIGRGTLNSYATAFGLPQDVRNLLKFFCGESPPAEYDASIKPRDRKSRRLFLTEFSDADQQTIVNAFRRNPGSIVRRVFRGSAGIPPDWLLLIRDLGKRETQLVRMEDAIALFAAGPVQISSRGNLEIGGVTMQRKGATHDPRPNDLQFKVKLEPVWVALQAKARA